MAFNKGAVNNVANKTNLTNNNIFYTENNRNGIYEIYKNKKKSFFLYKNIKMPLTAKNNNRNNSLTKKEKKIRFRDIPQRN